MSAPKRRKPKFRVGDVVCLRWGSIHAKVIYVDRDYVSLSRHVHGFRWWNRKDLKLIRRERGQ